MNTIGMITLIRKEVGRFANVYIQTIITPIITTLLFYVVFSLALGGNERMVGNMPYMAFLLPGLIMMSMIQNAFANTSSSIMVSKVQGNIVDVLMPPLSPFEILVGYVIAGMIRGMVVGVASIIPVMFFISVVPFSLSAVILYVIFGTLIMSSLGFIAGLWSEKFENLAAISNFIVVPLTFLSGTFYSIHSLGHTWQAILHANPFYYLIDGFRYGMTGYSESDLWQGLGILGINAVGLLIFAYAMILTGYKTKT